MLFNSHLFIFIFFPLVLLGYYFTLKSRFARLPIVWLILASLVFYGWYNPVYLLLIAFSVICNFAVGNVMAGADSMPRRKLFLWLGITVNILLLGYFKYANFFVDNVNSAFGTDFHLNTIILPVAISFFTLQQITYLVDTYRQQVGPHSFLDYCLFVTFFPKLTAGPIMRFREMMPQISVPRMPPLNRENIAVGLTVFFLGLFKKAVLADSLAQFANPVFSAASSHLAVSFFYSWSGALAYTFQLYFDFSGYCDMAIGLGLILGIRLPLNFYSPYKATSIIDFWRRWHITLSTFIRDYLYIPLGGNRKGFRRQLVNLLTAMLIVGFWHGAGWTFIVWGGLHGVYLTVNHAWRRLWRRQNADQTRRPLVTVVSVFFTFFVVTLAWVFFRADSLSAAVTILKGMAGFSGFALTPGFDTALGAFGRFLGHIGIQFRPLPGFSYESILWIAASLVICWFLPNAQEYMGNYRPSLDRYPGEPEFVEKRWLRWAPDLKGAVIIAIIMVLSILALTRVSTFIYYQF